MVLASTCSPRWIAPLLRAAAACCALLAAVPPARAHDEEAEESEIPEVPVRVLRPNAFRGAGMAQVGGFFEGPLWDSFSGVTYARQLHEAVALELTAGEGTGGDEQGPHAGTGVRFSLGGRDRSAFTVGAGGHVAFLERFGAVGFGHLEAAWELRTRSGVDFILGGGVGITLTRSRTVVHQDCAHTWFGRCGDERFEAGDSTLFLRTEIGYAF